MSIGIYAFLGSGAENIEARVVHALGGLGFGVEFPAETNLLTTSQTGILYVQIKQTPPYLSRVEPELPLLIGIEYGVVNNEGKVTRRDGWPPKGVKKFSYLISTRTASGRSRAAYFMQALILAILAKETHVLTFTEI